MSGATGRPRPMSTAMAFLSDIHGNLRALDAVCDELTKRGVHDVYVAGDLLLGGDRPVEVFKRLQQIGARCVRGLSDTALTRVKPETLKPVGKAQQELADRFAETRRAVGELALKFLEKLPEQLRIPMVDGGEIVLVHGSPADPTVEMTHEMSDEEIMALCADDPADIVVCGGSHVPFMRTLESLQVVNVGSVGAAPEGGVAHYTIISPRMEGTLIEQSWVEIPPAA